MVTPYPEDGHDASPWASPSGPPRPTWSPGDGSAPHPSAGQRRGQLPAGQGCGPPPFTRPRRRRAPLPVQVAAALTLLGALVALALGLLFVVSLIGIVLAPVPLLLAAALGTGSVLVLRGGRVGVVVLSVLHGLSTALSVVDLVTDRGPGVPLGLLWSPTVLVLLWLPSSQAWLWRRPREDPWDV